MEGRESGRVGLMLDDVQTLLLLGFVGLQWLRWLLAVRIGTDGLVNWLLQLQLLRRMLLLGRVQQRQRLQLVVSGGSDDDAVRLELDGVVLASRQRVMGHVPGRADQSGRADGQAVGARALLLGLVLGLARGRAVVQLGLGLHLPELLARLLPPPAGAAEFAARLGRTHGAVDGRADGTERLQLLHQSSEHG